jgi:hypothetical protein
LSRGEAVSVTGKMVRLTDERWLHVERRHPELRGWKERVLDAVRDPSFVVQGRYGELLAVRSSASTGYARSLVVVYRESSKDGFIITAYLTSDTSDLEKREKTWPSLF